MTVVGAASRPLQYLRAVAQSDLATGTKATCWAIASYADNDTGRAHPSLKALAGASGLSQAVLSKHTARAEEAGYLRKERRQNNSIIYTITVPPDAGPRLAAITPAASWMPSHISPLDCQGAGSSAAGASPTNSPRLGTHSVGATPNNPLPNYLRVLPQ